MSNKLLCLLLPLGLLFAPGCTLIGAAAGGGLAAHSNHQDEVRRLREGEPDPESEPSIMPGVLTGAGIGFIVDAVLVSMAISAISLGPTTLHDGSSSFYGWSND